MFLLQVHLLSLLLDPVVVLLSKALQTLQLLHLTVQVGVLRVAKALGRAHQKWKSLLSIISCQTLERAQLCPTAKR